MAEGNTHAPVHPGAPQAEEAAEEAGRKLGAAGEELLGLRAAAATLDALQAERAPAEAAAAAERAAAEAERAAERAAAEVAAVAAKAAVAVRVL